MSEKVIRRHAFVVVAKILYLDIIGWLSHTVSSYGMAVMLLFTFHDVVVEDEALQFISNICNLAP